MKSKFVDPREAPRTGPGQETLESQGAEVSERSAEIEPVPVPRIWRCGSTKWTAIGVNPVRVSAGSLHVETLKSERASNDPDWPRRRAGPKLALFRGTCESRLGMLKMPTVVPRPPGPRISRSFPTMRSTLFEQPQRSIEAGRARAAMRRRVGRTGGMIIPCGLERYREPLPSKTM